MITTLLFEGQTQLEKVILLLGQIVRYRQLSRLNS